MGATIDLRSIATPLEQCVCLEIGTVDPARVAELRARDFDQAPVIGPGRTFVGVIETVAAERLARDAISLDPESGAIERARLPAECAVDDVLGRLGLSSGALVEEDGRDAWLITMSDLNRHRFRSILYASFAELEALLARLIDVTYSDPWAWLERLREDAQARLVGYWQIATRKNVDIGPQAGATLTEMLLVVAASAELRSALGYVSRNAFDRETGGFPDYRNRVMHPARPLILNRREVEDLRSAMQRIAWIIDRARRVLADRGYGSRVLWL